MGFTADIAAVFAPETDQAAVQGRLAANGHYEDKMPALVDACWGLERMIAALAAIPSEDVGPFPRSSS